MKTSLKPLLAALLLAPLLALANQVNINTADADTLAKELSGIGPAKAARIVDYRTKHGPFKSIDELALVKGIGTKFIERNRSDLRVDRPAGQPPATTRLPVIMKLPPNAKPANAKPAKQDKARQDK